MNRLVSSLVCAALGFVVAQCAYASGISISPVKILFRGGDKSHNLTVTNAGEQPVSVQGQLRAWSLSAKGTDEFAETGEVVFFPKIFTLQPGEEAVVRIGRKALTPPDREQAYRLFLSELPVEGTKTTGINMVLTLSLPVFVQTAQPERAATIGEVTLTGGTLTVVADNPGDTFYVAKQIEAVGLDGAGGEVFRESRTGWYVLAGARRPFPLKLNPESCRAAMRIEVTLDDGEQVRAASLEVNPDDCRADASVDGQ